MISARLIQKCADLICKTICEFFNQSIIQGGSQMIGNARDDINNNRPIFCNTNCGQSV